MTLFLPTMYRLALTCLFLTFLLTACGGGGGSSAPSPVSQTADETETTEDESDSDETDDEEPTTEDPDPGGYSAPFEPYQNYEQMCEIPRSGVDTQGNPFPDVQGNTADENNWLRSWSNELYL